MRRPVSNNTEEVFLAEALGHACARSVKDPVSGKLLLPKGALIDPRAVARLAAQGIDRVMVYHKPRVSIIIIGEGLLSPGTASEPGRSYDFSGMALKAALETMKIRPVFLRRLSDEPKKIAQVVSFAVNQSDVVVLVAKELEKSVSGIRRFIKDLRAQFIVPEKGDSPSRRTAVQKGMKPIYVLPYDMDLIFEHFDNTIRPAILSFMGCARLSEPSAAL